MTVQTSIPRLTGEELLTLMVAHELRTRQQRRGHLGPPEPFPPCPVCQVTVTRQDTTLGLEDEHQKVLTLRPCGHRMSYNLKVVYQLHGKARELADQREAVAARPEPLHVRVRSVVKARRLKQVWIAQQIHTSDKRLSELLNGRARMSLEWAERILDVCGMELVIDIRPKGGGS